jgi:hypothetical protein
MRKEEYCENIEEVVTLRVKVVNLNKNVEDRISSTPSIEKFEEKLYMVL